MKPLNLPALLIPALIFGIVGNMVLSLHPAFMFTPFLGLLFAAVAAGLFYYGRKVVAFKAGKNANMSATSALSVAMFAYSSAWVSTAAVGFLAGAMIAMVGNLHAIAVRSNMVAAIISAVGALVLLVVAVIVERWCQLDDDDDRNAPSSGLEQKAG